MKKFLLFALCAISACSVFAEPFSMAKYRELKQNKKHLQAINYCYQSEISSESDYNHLYQYINKLAIDKNFKLTKNEIDQCIKKFDNAPKLTELNKQNIAVAFYVQCGLTSDAQKIINENNATVLKLVFFRNSFNGARKSLNKQLMWKYGKQVLLIDGGYTDYNNANVILNTIFRYKPSNITKEEQIEFLSKLAQIYPIPGTDFNQWKSFMGFVGFKYKQLTGKDLY